VSGARPVVTLYGRPGCHLCEEARAIVLRAAERVAFELVEVDIESDDELFKRLLERIPVIAVDGEERFELFVEEDELVSALSSAHL
jgi:glutaredoxin